MGRRTTITCDKCGLQSSDDKEWGEMEFDSIGKRELHFDLCPECCSSLWAWFSSPDEQGTRVCECRATHAPGGPGGECLNDTGGRNLCPDCALFVDRTSVTGMDEPPATRASGVIASMTVRHGQPTTVPETPRCTQHACRRCGREWDEEQER